MVGGGRDLPFLRHGEREEKVILCRLICFSVRPLPPERVTTCTCRFRRVEPSTDVEKTTMKLFADLLQTPEDELSAADDFFLVGGTRWFC